MACAPFKAHSVHFIPASLGLFAAQQVLQFGFHFVGVFQRRQGALHGAHEGVYGDLFDPAVDLGLNRQVGVSFVQRATVGESCESIGALQHGVELLFGDRAWPVQSRDGLGLEDRRAARSRDTIWHLTVVRNITQTGGAPDGQGRSGSRSRTGRAVNVHQAHTQATECSASGLARRNGAARRTVIATFQRVTQRLHVESVFSFASFVCFLFESSQELHFCLDLGHRLVVRFAQ